VSEALPTGETGVALDKDAARWQQAKEVRQQYPDWVVIWIARTGQFRAYPKFRALRGTAPTAQTPEELGAQMEQAERAARKPR
jgi:hypothetical protein